VVIIRAFDSHFKEQMMGKSTIVITFIRKIFLHYHEDEVTVLDFS